MRRRLTLSTVLLSVASAACASSTSGSDTGQGSSVVGTGGGSVKSGGSSVTIPADALASDVTISLTQAPGAPTPAGAIAVGSAYTYGPEGQMFRQPVTVILQFDPARLPVGRTAAEIVVFTAPAGSSSYASIGGTLVDSTHIAAQTTHFSTFVPVVPSSATDAGLIMDAETQEPDGASAAGDTGPAAADAAQDATPGLDVTTAADAAAISPDAGTLPDTGTVVLDAATFVDAATGVDASGRDAASACTPRTCAQQAIACGLAGDGCGGEINCGYNCAAGTICGGGGPSQCGVGSCVTRTCSSAGAQCGVVADGCGGVINCGVCPVGQVCGLGSPYTCGAGG
jgi:hypothetical protein